MAARSLDEIKEDIRSRCDIVDVIGGVVPLKKAGASHKGLCPFHQEKTPSFNVDAQRQIFHCFGCHEGGDVFSFIMKYQNIDFMDALRELGSRVGIEVEVEASQRKGGVDKETLYNLLGKLTTFYQRVLHESPAGAEARAYLEQRKLSAQTIKDFQIGFAPNRWDTSQIWARKNGFAIKQLEMTGMINRRERPADPSQEWYDRFRGRLMFPIHNPFGRVIGFSGRILDPEASPAKYMNSPETLLFKKSQVWFGMNRARDAIHKAGRALICEGQIDVIRCHEVGLTHTVAAQGTALTPHQARALKRLTDEVVLVLDGDEAGRTAALRSAEVFLSAGLVLKAVALPPGEDPDSIVLKQGAAALHKTIENAQDFLDFQVDLLLAREEDPTAEAALMRVAREVLRLVNVVPSAVRQERMLQQAAARLGISVDALGKDLAQVPTPAPSPARSATPASGPTTRARPASREASPHTLQQDELGLLELCAASPEALAEAVRYLYPGDFAYPAASLIFAAMVAQPSEAMERLQSLIPPEEEEAARLAAQIQLNSRSIGTESGGAVNAMRGMLICIRQKALEKRRSGLMTRPAPAGQQEIVQMEIVQLTMAINTLGESRINHNWDRALPLMEAYHEPAPPGTLS